MKEIRLLKKELITKEMGMPFYVFNPEYISALKRAGKDPKTGKRRKPRFIKKKIWLTGGEYFPFGSLYQGKQRDLEMPLVKEDTMISLRPKQIPVFEDCKRKKGCLVYGTTGFGKTIIACALHDVWRGKALILSHSLENVQYFKNQFKDFIDVDAGVYYSKKKDIQPVTITTHDSFRSKWKMFAEFVHSDGQVGFDTLIIDESDAFFTVKAIIAICSFPALRKFGFTGTKHTPYDECNKGEALPRFYGHMTVAEDDEAKNPLKNIFYHRYEKTYTRTVGEEEIPIATHNWIKFRERLDEDIQRKREQLKYLLDNTDESESVLVFFDRVDDVESFYAALKKRGLKCFMSHGSMDAADRERDNANYYKEGGYMVAQYMTKGRGYDNDKASKCFILFPIKGENTLRQIIGRVKRWLTGKESSVFMWYDSMLEKQHKERVRICRKYFKINPERI